MKKQKLIICITLILNSLLSFGQENTKVTYIANEGFLIEAANKKILVDGLFDRIDGDWCDSPSDSVVELMEKAEAPFDNIDLILITHQHRDHFNKDVVAKHLLNNPKAKIICPKQVEKALSENANYASFKTNIIAITPQMFADSTVSVSDIDIRILRLEHSHYMIEDTATREMLSKHRNVENLGFVFIVNGTKLFHCGDTNPLNEKEYATFALVEDEIDIAFIERLFFSKGKKSIEILNTYIAPKSMVLMHISPVNKSMFINFFKEEKAVKIFENKMDFYNY